MIDLLNSFIVDPENIENNLNLAIYYHEIDQTASATSYYLRAAEKTEDDLVKYLCILRAAMCFTKQGCRNFTVKGLYQHALAIMPKRPEGYFLLSRFYEREGNYHDSYLIASLGEQAIEEFEKLSLDVEYPGMYGILFQKAVSSWWCGLCDESRNIFQNLKNNYEMDEIHTQSVDDNLNRLWTTNQNLHSVYSPKLKKKTMKTL